MVKLYNQITGKKVNRYYLIKTVNKRNIEQHQILNQILESKTFAKSTTSNVLLRFLVQSATDERDLSASDIGEEIFGKNYSLEKSEANARVNIYHLRKKLEQYYNNEGKSDAIRLTIDRGQYGVRFISNVEQKKRFNKLHWAIIVPVIGLVISTVLITQTIKQEKNRVWYDLLDIDTNTVLYGNDVFGYSGPTHLGNKGFHRDFSINSLEEYYAAFDTVPNAMTEFTPAKYSYLSFSDAMSMLLLSQYLGQQGVALKMRKGSNFSILDFKEQNSIFIGPTRNQLPFSELLNKLAKNVSLKGKSKKHLLINQNGKEEIVHLSSDGETFEHGIVAKLKGPNNHTHYFFLSDHGIGQTAVVEYFTNKATLIRFSEKYLKNGEDEFVALFYVQGQDRTNLSIELKWIDYNK